MRNILDSFNNLSLVLRIAIIAGAVILIPLGGIQLYGMFASDDNTTEDIAVKTPEPETITKPETEVEPEAQPDTSEDITPPEPVEDPEAPIGEDDSAAAVEPTEPALDEPIEEAPEPAQSAEAVKAAQDEGIQALWDANNWTAVTLNDVYGPDDISVNFYPDDANAIDTYGAPMMGFSLMGIEIPYEVQTEAVNRMKAFLTDAQTIVVEPSESDDQSKVYIHADFVNVQEVLLEEGLAIIDLSQDETAYNASFTAYEQDAKDAKIGIWGK